MGCNVTSCCTFPSVSSYNFCFQPVNASHSVEPLATAAAHSSTRVNSKTGPSTSPALAGRNALHYEKSSATRIAVSFWNTSRYSFLPFPSSSNLCCLSHHTGSGVPSLTYSLSAIEYFHMVFKKGYYMCRRPKSFPAMHSGLARVFYLFCISAVWFIALLRLKRTSYHNTL